MSVVTVMPVYNVAPLLPAVLRAAAAAVPELLVVDDGSTDGTAELLAHSGVPRLTHEVNRGKGTALRTAFRALLARPEVTGVLTMDGDGQHLPDEAARFLTAHAEAPDAILLGNRWHDGQSAPGMRGLANGLSTWIVRRFSGQVVRDSQCGYRLYPRAFLERVTPLLPETRFEIETLLLLQAARLGVAMVNLPVSTIYTAETLRLSKWRAARDSWRIVRVLVQGMAHRLPR